MPFKQLVGTTFCEVGAIAQCRDCHGVGPLFSGVGGGNRVKETFCGRASKRCWQALKNVIGFREEIGNMQITWMSQEFS